ncbi:alpha/beta-hydrolase [Dendrothele bispora CBS 962.96]|uniref:Alpha/beta-hydrolase n=1 Tax=Dendrothele bispora (strain CBS 962.96) TaxID=1314807 RepID=A0A4S8MGB9_DENBC|nr:alpha/beta-hydrolase [Dendrothele bispora CBS 962.96]
MFLSLPCLLMLMSTVLSAHSSPEVEVGGTTFVGRKIPFEQEFFGGIPFAKPPVGTLRFQPPVFKDTYDEDILDASQSGLPCLQFNSTLDQSSEDCLTLNILRPANLSANASLPVLFCNTITVNGHGGDRETAKENKDNTTTTHTHKRQSGTPIVYVSINYRLGPLGFPQGKEPKERKALNLALKDELAALKWVHKHIGKFGGDNQKVTAGGVSAGAIMNAILFLDPGIEKFVRGGSPLLPIRYLSPDPPQPLLYAMLLPDNTTGTNLLVVYLPAQVTCASLAGTNNTFDCLVDANVTDLLEGIKASRELAEEDFPWDPTIDGPGGVYPDYPSMLFQIQHFARIPFITGTSLDEGTIFADISTNYTNDVVRDNLFKNLSTPFLQRSERFKLDQSIQEMLELYPDDPSLGSPFGTGNKTFCLSPGFKRMSAIYNDIPFLSRRRFWQQTMAKMPSSGVKSYGYLWKQSTKQITNKTAMFGGAIGLPEQQEKRSFSDDITVSHATDTHYFFNDSLVDTRALELGTSLRDYFLSFVDSLSPNDEKGTQRPHWNHYSKDNQVIMQMAAQNLTEVPDTFRKDQVDFINSLPDIFHH